MYRDNSLCPAMGHMISHVIVCISVICQYALLFLQQHVSISFDIQHSQMPACKRHWAVRLGKYEPLPFDSGSTPQGCSSLRSNVLVQCNRLPLQSDCQVIIQHGGCQRRRTLLALSPTPVPNSSFFVSHPFESHMSNRRGMSVGRQCIVKEGKGARRRSRKGESRYNFTSGKLGAMLCNVQSATWRKVNSCGRVQFSGQSPYPLSGCMYCNSTLHGEPNTCEVRHHGTCRK